MKRAKLLHELATGVERAGGVKPPVLFTYSRIRQTTFPSQE